MRLRALVASALLSQACATPAEPARSAPAPSAVVAAPTAPAPHPPTAPPPVSPEPEAKPAPPPPPFADRTRVRYDELVAEMRRVADGLTSAPAVLSGYQALLSEYGLREEDVSLQSYSRVRLAFEATRDGGLWGVRWTVTDQMPWSDQIWKQWEARDWSADVPEITAQAECDELSALFSMVARDLGAEGYVGLFWPTWNHTVAVWQLEKTPTHEAVRILVPTSQVWLSREATLGSREFKTNRVVFPYERRDLKPEHELPVALARYLIHQLELYGDGSNERLLERRNRLGGS